MPFDSTNYQPIPEGHRRLLVLAEFLETVPPERFDITFFSNAGDLPLHEARCGTAGCALGWCPSVPEFAALGWRIHPAWRAAVWGDRDSTFGSAGDFFAIDGHIQDYFFTIGEYYVEPSPKDVAARIRAFVAEQAKVTA